MKKQGLARDFSGEFSNPSIWWPSTTVCPKFIGDAHRNLTFET